MQPITFQRGYRFGKSTTTITDERVVVVNAFGRESRNAPRGSLLYDAHYAQWNAEFNTKPKFKRSMGYWEDLGGFVEAVESGRWKMGKLTKAQERDRKRWNQYKPQDPE